MAEKFTSAGIPSLAVTSTSSREVRKAALDALRDRKVNVLFTVDLFNEGLDIPTVDTVLFLRPTESATVFLQQLGRGLRLAEDKPCLTVLDFIGAQHQDFRFDLRFRALTGSTRREVQRDVETGFPTLPAGCHIELDRVAQEIVLANIKQSLTVSWRGLIAEASRERTPTLGEFLRETGVELEDLYRTTGRSWLDLQRAARHVEDVPGPDDRRLANAFARMLHIDDPERLRFIRDLATSAAANNSRRDIRSRRLAAMLHFSLFGQQERFSSVEASLERFLGHPGRVEELAQLTHVLLDRVQRVTPSLATATSRPLHLHARYTQMEGLAAFGRESLANAFGAGVWWIPEENADLFFVTLQKTESHYSPTTMYADHAISPMLFQWESQNTTRPETGVGRRYINHRELGTSVHLFLRETKTADGNLGAPPYLYAGPMSYLSHTGERPMRIHWKLDYALPADVFHAAKVA
jgi:hypothetical protein